MNILQRSILQLGIILSGSSFVWAQEEVKILIDTGHEHQQLYGFGASDAWRCQFVGKYWPLEKRERIADLLFSKEFDKAGNPKGIGLSLWRFYIGAGSMEQGDSSRIKNGWRRAECFQHADGTYDWNKQAGQRWFLNAARKRGVEKFLAFTNSVPVHMTLNGKAFNGSGTHDLNIIPEKLPDYAGFLVDVVEHFKDQEGILFDYVSPINEPQWAWDKPTQEGTPATNRDIYTVAKLLSHQLSQRKLSTRVLLGEAGDIRCLYKSTSDKGNDRQIRAFYGKGTPLNLTGLPNVQHAITAHSYFTTWPVKDMIGYRKALRDTLLSVDPTLEYWQTEFCILEKNDDIGSGDSRDLGINTALYFARVIHHDLVLTNACSWQFWTALSEADFKDGLIYLDNGNNGVRGDEDPNSKSLQYDGFVRTSKTLWALGNYSLFVRPGMKRIDIQYSAPNLRDEEIANGLMVSGFIHKPEKKLVLVCVNYANEEKRLTIDNKNNTVGIAGNIFKTFTTSATKDLAMGKCNANQIIISPRSVVTLVGKIK